MERTSDKIVKYWPIILFLVGLIVTWTQFNARITAVEAEVATMNPTYLQIQKDIVEIKTSLFYIKEKIDGR